MAVVSVSEMAEFAFIENGLAFVVFGAVAFSLIMSFLFLTTRGSESAYDRIGAGGMTKESEYGEPEPFAGASSPVPVPGRIVIGDGGRDRAAAERVEREREIRQLLNARSERLVRAGQPALDVDAELARLLAASISPSSSETDDDASPPPEGQPTQRARDPALLAEVRQLVVARNERRARQGLEALDVDAEVARTLEELDP